jgi:transcriptional regulator with XRE-family HTH domain
MKIDSSASFGKALQKRRKELKYTQEYVSEVTGLSASFISNLENGKKTTELEKAIMLANVLGLDIDVSVRGQ